MIPPKWLQWVFIALLIAVYFCWFIVPDIIDWIEMERTFKKMDKELKEIDEEKRKGKKDETD